MLDLIKNIIPQKILKYLKNKKIILHNKKINKLPRISVEELRKIIVINLKIKKGDTVFVHSALGNLNLSCSPFDVLKMLLEVVGDDGTLLFPTYPKLTSLKFLESKNIFNQKKTPSYMGILSELARRHPNANRSLHPTKSVVAIGKNSSELVKYHQNSVYPYDINSPYYKINNYNGKIIGIGVGTTNLSCVHCVDDFMKDLFPIEPYDNRLFKAKCVNENNEIVYVETYAHNMKKMKFDIPKFVKKHISNDVCEDININGMRFFIADSNKLFEKLLSLAKSGLTIYNN